MISPVEFDLQTETIIEQFKKTTPNQFMETFQFIQTINQANQLASLFLSNWVFFLNYSDPTKPLLEGFLIDVLAQPTTYDNGNCSCGIQSNCSTLSDFPFRLSNQSIRATLSGFLVGCYSFDALLQSTLLCLYNQTCMDIPSCINLLR